MASKSYATLSRVLLACILMLAACTPRSDRAADASPILPASPSPTASSSNTTDGGQHGGGGHVQTSTSAQVRATITKSLALFQETTQQNVFGAMLMDSTAKYFKADPKDQQARLPKLSELYRTLTGEKLQCFLADEGTAGCLTKSERDSRGSVIKKSPVRIEEDQDCGSEIDQHADASVDRFASGAEICFSVKNLRRLPPSSLQREILSLLLHEAAHIAGYDESVAQRIQGEFSEYYAFRFGQANNRFYQLQIDGTLATARNLVTKLRAWDETDPDPFYFTASIGQLAQIIRGFPVWGDPVALTLVYEPRPRAVAAYIYAVKNLIIKTHRLVASEECNESLCWSKDAVPFSKTDLKIDLLDIEADLKNIETNWQAVTGNPNVSIVCTPAVTNWPTDLRDEKLLMNGDFEITYGSISNPSSCERPEKN